MYRCDICEALSGPKQSRLTYHQHRFVGTFSVKAGVKIPDVRKEIKREWAVCTLCHARLENGVPLETLLSINQEVRNRDRALPPYVQGGPRPKPKPLVIRLTDAAAKIDGNPRKAAAEDPAVKKIRIVMSPPPVEPKPAEQPRKKSGARR